MNKIKTVLFVDDEQVVRKSIEQWLVLADYEVLLCESAKEAIRQLTPHFPGVVVTDVKMTGMSGVELLQYIVRECPDIPVILLTGHGDIAMAVESIQQGAYDFIEKPYDPERLLEAIGRAQERRTLFLENLKLRQQLEQRDGIRSRIIGESASMELLRRQILDLADTNASVLIHGETGSGKEMVAQSLHDFSARSSANFVPINCGAVPESIFESELFGHESGAFTGAAKSRVGRFEYANRGSLFLDEIGSMPFSLQVKVLRALQEREIIRLGSNQGVPIDIRLITATKLDLRTASLEGKFREDLYYRLAVTELYIPPLRERREDIVLLFEHYASEARRVHSRESRSLTAEDIAALENYNWPGNVRELKNISERFVLSGTAAPGLEQILFPGKSFPLLGAAETDVQLSERMAVFEKHAIEQALNQHHGNIKAVMEMLGLPRRTLNQKMAVYKLKREDYLNVI
ncbi:MAG: sigma-54-dependent Fis family transcriptional regulator [SAR324 cluster bacterium]|nr:sigma-54-dependent Fis family transcriptional regulator [SAR324 cluster bacterium]MBL7035263.1 sigma-54-dependent Fis family transcriptional regulator [SAR324 cluster bacterium]